MKKVFKIDAEEETSVLIKQKYEYFVFAKDIQEATKKVQDTLSEKTIIVNVELYCIVEEDSDLKKYLEE